MIRRRLLVALIITSCGRATPAGPISQSLPSLRLHHQSSRVDDSPRFLMANMVVNPHGMVLFGDKRGDGFLFTMLDSNGAFVRRVGPIGEGPGEARGGELVSFTDTSYSLGQLNAFGRYRLDGKAIEEARLAEPIVLRVGPSDRTAIGLRNTRQGYFPAMVTAGDSHVRQLVAPADSFIQSTFPTTMFADGQSHIAVLGLWAGGFVVADGWRYRLALYDMSGRVTGVLGRDLPKPHLTEARINAELSRELDFLRSRHGPQSGAEVARQRAEIAARALPYFTHTSHVGLDGRGRIWVLGRDADSGFADVFNQRTFLGRIALPCPAFEESYAINGDWMVLACAPGEDASDVDAIFKVFRIVN